MSNALRNDFVQDDVVSETIAPESLLAKAIETITARSWRHQGDAFLARHTATIQPILPEISYLTRRGVDLVALAGAIDRGLNVEQFGQVMEYRDWSVEEFNLFARAGIDVKTINDAMKRFLEDPRNF